MESMEEDALPQPLQAHRDLTRPQQPPGRFKNWVFRACIGSGEDVETIVKKYGEEVNLASYVFPPTHECSMCAFKCCFVVRRERSQNEALDVYWGPWQVYYSNQCMCTNHGRTPSIGDPRTWDDLAKQLQTFAENWCKNSFRSSEFLIVCRDLGIDPCSCFQWTEEAVHLPHTIKKESKIKFSGYEKDPPPRNAHEWVVTWTQAPLRSSFGPAMDADNSWECDCNEWSDLFDKNASMYLYAIPPCRHLLSLWSDSAMLENAGIGSFECALLRKAARSSIRVKSS